MELVYVEEHEHIGAAFAREKQIQNWSRAKRLALIEQRWTTCTSSPGSAASEVSTRIRERIRWGRPCRTPARAPGLDTPRWRSAARPPISAWAGGHSDVGAELVVGALGCRRRT